MTTKEVSDKIIHEGGMATLFLNGHAYHMQRDRGCVNCYEMGKKGIKKCAFVKSDDWEYENSVSSIDS